MDRNILQKYVDAGDVIGFAKHLLAEVERLEKENEAMRSILTPEQMMYLIYGEEE